MAKCKALEAIRSYKTVQSIYALCSDIGQQEMHQGEPGDGPYMCPY